MVALNFDEVLTAALVFYIPSASIIPLLEPLV